MASPLPSGAQSLSLCVNCGAVKHEIRLTRNCLILKSICAPPHRPSPCSRYNQIVDGIIRIAADVLTFLFFVGLVGSAAVVIISFFQDLHELFED